jgi:DNA-binding MarR family transcriptional regulator
MSEMDERGAYRAPIRSGRAAWRRLRRMAEHSQAQFLDVLAESERETLLGLVSPVLESCDQTRLQAAAVAHATS